VEPRMAIRFTTAFSSQLSAVSRSSAFRQR
jgi:hypothetical protein